jgi:indolepyruvate ferredoxin oxidoreductase
MALWMDRGTEGFTQMGGEGANWVGEAPFSTRDHVFQNLGDGTYNHSGILALRWAAATRTNITYKILFNDAVAMTGGQRHEGGLTVDMVARQVAAEGVKRIALVTDEPHKYPSSMQWPAGLTISHRDDLDGVQRELAATPGTTVMIYDQTCAAEKRRRRKRGQFPDPDKRIMINSLVCEGCGDCGLASNCVSVPPLETVFGRTRRIDQSNCNKDFSCVNGFCPSFVTVHGAKPKKAAPLAGPGTEMPPVPEPVEAPIGDGWAAIITGVGGTGVVTVGAILGMAAHLEGKGCGMIDMAGLAQKGGAVSSHIRLAATPEAISAIRVSAGKADLVLGCDMVVTGSKKVLASMRSDETLAIVNTAEIMPGDFARNADFSLPTERLKRAISSAAGRANTHFVDATGLATVLFGNSIAANMFMLGFAYQHGGLPLGHAALEKAIELNGEAVPMNLAAFRWGRLAAHDGAAVEAIVAKARPQAEPEPAQDLASLVARRAAFLIGYQNAGYAARYRAVVERMRVAEEKRVPGGAGLAEAVARYLFKLMAYKDEYEVARLYTDRSFRKQLESEFDGVGRLEFHLAPPILGRRNAKGEPVKTTFGPWILTAFGVLARFKGLRGTPLDIFGYTAERRTERRLIADYERLMDEVAGRLTPENHALAVGLANIPEKIRGYGHVKQRHLDVALKEQAALKQRFDAAAHAPTRIAAE